ncbi:MAG: rare lipoprotein A [Bacteroidetes bacterium]|nr:MAG: rare lipoprotein A [Bacteroidota bacterium]
MRKVLGLVFTLTVSVLLIPARSAAQTDTLKPPRGEAAPVMAPRIDTTISRDSVKKELTETGIASWYGKKFEGRKTSSGELFRPDSMTAAHKTLPFGTLVRVTNLKNDSVIVVKITDRLPKSSTRCIDLSSGAAKKLNFLRAGITPVKLEIIGTAPINKPKKSVVPAKK